MIFLLFLKLYNTIQKKYDLIRDDMLLYVGEIIWLIMMMSHLGDLDWDFDLGWDRDWVTQVL